MNCYYCGKVADDVAEHIPPKALFKGTNEWLNAQAMKVGLLTVPSCSLHNSEGSEADDFFAYLISDWAISNSFAMNVRTLQTANLSELYANDYERFKHRLSLLGCSVRNRKGKKAFDAADITREEKLNILRASALKCYRGLTPEASILGIPDDKRLAVDWGSVSEAFENTAIKEYSWNPNDLDAANIIISGNENVFWGTWVTPRVLLMTFYSTIRCVVRPESKS